MTQPRVQVGIISGKTILRFGMALVLVGVLLRKESLLLMRPRALLMATQPHHLETTKVLQQLKRPAATTATAIEHKQQQLQPPPPLTTTTMTTTVTINNKTSSSVVSVMAKSQRGKTNKNKKTRVKKQPLLFQKNLKTLSSSSSIVSLPPLYSLIGDLRQNITGNVQSLLDFAIVGFGKCGTTTLISWLDRHPEINTIPNEALHLSRHRPALMVQKLYQMKLQTYASTTSIHNSLDDDMMDDQQQQQLVPQQQNQTIQEDINNNNTHHPMTMTKGRRRILQGFKNPSDIRRPEAMNYLRQHWPETKLLITVRHPVSWFQSLYNFLLNEMGRSHKYLRHPKENGGSLLGGPHKNTHFAHTGKGEFHAILSLLGKTNMESDDELELLKGFLRQDEVLNWPQPLPNPIFFLEMSQMRDTNTTRAKQFRIDVQTFLGLTEPLPPLLHVRPGKDRKIDESLKIDMCRPENEEIRQELMRISRKASLWLRNYFLQSKDVVVSSREYLKEIFATTWMQDPCEQEVVDTTTTAATTS